MSAVLYRLQSLLEQCRRTLLPNGEPISYIAVIDMLAHNWHLGLTSFGGPPVHFQIFQGLYVDRYQWIDQTTYQELFALCQALRSVVTGKSVQH
jgi:hypothetical protein